LQEYIKKRVVLPTLLKVLFLDFHISNSFSKYFLKTDLIIADFFMSFIATKKFFPISLSLLIFFVSSSISLKKLSKYSKIIFVSFSTK